MDRLVKACGRAGAAVVVRGAGVRPTHRLMLPAGRVSGQVGLHSDDCAAWRHLDRGHTPAVEHHKPITMAGAKHAGGFRKRFDDSLRDVLLVTVILKPDIELVATHEADPQHYFCHGMHLTSCCARRIAWPVTTSQAQVQASKNLETPPLTTRYDAAPERRLDERLRGLLYVRGAPTAPGSACAQSGTKTSGVPSFAALALRVGGELASCRCAATDPLDTGSPDLSIKGVPCAQP
jgi:hypothetical protein